MEYTTFGGPHGPHVSTLALGVMMFGTTIDEPTSFAILDRFREAGGTFLDTADCYAFWIDGATGRESDAGTARITVRLPETLKSQVEAAAEREGVSVNAYLVRTLGAALQPGGPPNSPTGSSDWPQAGNQLSGWVQ